MLLRPNFLNKIFLSVKSAQMKPKVRDCLKKWVKYLLGLLNVKQSEYFNFTLFLIT